MEVSAKSPAGYGSENDILNILSKGTYGLQGLSDGCLRHIIRRSRISKFSAGSQIASSDQPMTHAFFILDGAIRIFSMSKGGREHFLSLMRTGAFYGATSCIDGGPCQHEVVAEEDLTLLLLPASDFLEFLDSNREFRAAIFELVLSRYRSIFNMLDQYAFASPQARLAYRLLSLGRAYGVPGGNGTEISLKFTQDNLAAMIGLSRQGTHRILKAFRKDGLIRMDYGRIVLLDQDALQEIVDEFS